jgi:DME family drug/metabolite transporter
MDHPNVSHAMVRRGMVLVCVAACLWGTAAVGIKELYRISDLNAFSVGFFRFGLAFPAIALTCRKRLGNVVFQVGRSEYPLLFFLGLALAQYHICYYAAIMLVGVTLSALITLCSAPVLVAVISSIFLRQKHTPRVMLALSMALLGTGLLVGTPESLGTLNCTMVGIILSLGSALGYALVTIISRSLYTKHHPMVVTTFSFGVGMTMLLPVPWILGMSFQFSLWSWALILYIGLIPTGLAYILFFMGLKHVPPTVAAILTMAEPLTATILAWQIFDEKLSSLGWLGAAFLMGAVIVLFSADKFRSQQTLP